MRLSPLLLILTAFVCFLMSCEEKKVEVPQGWKQYKNFSYNFNFYYPPNWALTNQGHENLLFNLASPRMGEEDMIQENVNMVRIAMPDSISSLEAFLPTLHKFALDHYIEPKILLTEEAEFAGKDGIKQRYSAVTNETPIVWEQMIMLDGNDVLIWTFAAESARFDQYKDTADIISSTFMFE